MRRNNPHKLLHFLKGLRFMSMGPLGLGKLNNVFVHLWAVEPKSTYWAGHLRIDGFSVIKTDQIPKKLFPNLVLILPV